MSAIRNLRTSSPLTVPSLNRRRLLLGSAGVVAGGALLSACGSDSDSSTGAGASSGPASYGDISIQLSWIKNIEFGGEYYAIEKGYYKAAGFSNVTLIAGPTAAESIVAGGKAFVGLSAPPTTAAAIEQGAPLKIIGAQFQKNPFCLTSLAKTPITTPADMVGKKIGVQASNTSIFNGFLKANNIDPKSLTIVPVQFDPTVLTTGSVAGFFSYLTNEPITLTEQGNKVVTLSLAENGLPLVAETYTVLQETIDNDRAKLKALLSAEIKGWKDSLADPKGTAELAVTKYGKDQKLNVEEQTLEAEAQAKLIETEDTKANGLFTLTDELVAANIEALGRSGSTITADKLFDLSLIKEVHSEDPSLKG